MSELVTEFRGITLLDYHRLTRYDLLALKNFDLRKESQRLNTPEDVFYMYQEYFDSNRLLSTGMILRLDSDRLPIEGLLATLFTPEQMDFRWETKMREFVSGQELAYIHTHDEAHLPYVEGVGPLDGGLRHQLFPTNEDLAWSALLDTEGATRAQCYLIGYHGCLRFWPSVELEFFPRHLSQAKEIAFIQQVRLFYRSLGLAVP
jgi:hypothetical protein